MNEITIRLLTEIDLVNTSKQLTESYKSAYKGLMDETYLSALAETHWVETLRDSLLKGDTCVIAEHHGNIIRKPSCH